MASWKVELAIAIGVFAVIGILFGAGIFTPTHTANSAFNTNTNTTNLIPDVRVVSEQAQSPNGIFLVHYIVYGNVMNAGNGTSGPITVALQIKSPESAILLNTNETVVPDILSPKQEGTYTFKFTSDDLGAVSVAKQ